MSCSVFVCHPSRCGHDLKWFSHVTGTLPTNQSPHLIRLAPVAIDYDLVDGFDYTPWAKWRFATDEALWSWYRRVWQQLN
jgi:hypothetical protein